MDAKKIWEENNNYPYYDDIVSCFGEIILSVEDDDYQGDIRYFLKKGDKYGFTIIGFGSCSGCDWLQGCDSLEEKQELVDTVEREIEWFDSLEEIKNYFNTRDWELQYSWHANETKQFVEKVINFN